MAGPIKDVESGPIQCDNCRCKIPERERCNILKSAYNDDGVAQELPSASTYVLCGECGIIAISNERTDR